MIRDNHVVFIYAREGRTFQSRFGWHQYFPATKIFEAEGLKRGMQCTHHWSDREGGKRRSFISLRAMWTPGPEDPFARASEQHCT